MRLALCWMVSALVTTPAFLRASSSAEDLEGGKKSYSLLCIQCHGEAGDAVNYPDVLPLAGIKRRYPPEVIGQLSGTFSGRFLYRKDRERIVAYMSSLRGSKGFADPGWLISPYLLERKSPRIHEFRIIDTRGKAAYTAGHVANAVSVEPGACLTTFEETTRWLGALGITPTTMVVVYDHTGGPSAACVWWRIRRAGHQWVAVLDGGWKRWTAEHRTATTAVPQIKPTSYSDAEPGKGRRSPTRVVSLASKSWSWEATLDRDGFRSNEELSRLVNGFGIQPGGAFRLKATPEQLAHLALVLHLLGFGVDYDAATDVLSATGQ